MPMNLWAKRERRQAGDRSRVLGQSQRPGMWLVGGLGCQVVGLVIITLYLAISARHLTPGRALSAFTVELAWRHEMHTSSGIAFLIAGALLFISGTVMVARPFVRRRVTLLLAVPIAGTVGVLVLGVLALVVAAVVVVSSLAGVDGWDWANIMDFNWYSGGERPARRGRDKR